MTTIRRLQPQHRRQLILSAALRLAGRRGYREIEVGDVATEAKVSTALVIHYFGSMDVLRAAVLREAISREDLQVVAQGISHLDPVATEAPAALRRRAARWLLGRRDA